MSSNQKESTAERLERMKREKEAAREAAGGSDLVSHLTHESTGEPDFGAIAEKLEARKAIEAKGENEGYVKMTVYVREDVARSFNALITKRGQQKEFCNQAIKEFVQKKTKELGL